MNSTIKELVVYIQSMKIRRDDLIKYHHKSENSDEVKTVDELIKETQHKINAICK